MTVPELSDHLMERHPAERGPSRQRSVVVYACCSCCCCLHTLGSLAGALYGGGFKRLASDPGFDRERRIPMVHWLFDRLPRTQWIFWTSLVGVVFLVTAGLAVLFGFGGLTGGGPGLTEGLLVSLFGLAMLGPLVPVAAWVVSLIRLAFLTRGQDAADEFWLLHRMLLWSFVGALAGLLLMGLILLILMAAAR